MGADMLHFLQQQQIKKTREKEPDMDTRLHTDLVNVFDYEQLAEKRINPDFWAYFAGGSDDEITLRANVRDFARLRLRPRMLVDVRDCETSTTILGTPVSMPVLVAPTADHCLAHQEGECATVQGTGAAGTLMIASTMSSRSIEEIAQAASGPLWFQLYLHPTHEIAAALVQRAEKAGCKAIVLTVDIPVMGNREGDRRKYWTDPPPRANFAGLSVPQHRGASLTWQDVDWLRSVTSLPVIVKGILTAEDACIALEHGVSGIVVSNHGGRQLDSAVSSIEALPEVVEAVAGRCEVYVDGGVRRGTDILKALALGARAVLVGRPVIWGLAVNGAPGVQHILEILHTELVRAMKLSGCPTISSINRSLVKDA
jgi:isopentenyl diphosphate isomerase/L-lactate dehydrogenase-like FMN-dependent dehydrogenase